MIDDCSESVHDLLENTKIDKPRSVKPVEAGYHQILSYLLSWQLIVNFFTNAPAQVCIIFESLENLSYMVKYTPRYQANF